MSCAVAVDGVREILGCNSDSVPGVTTVFDRNTASASGSGLNRRDDVGRIGAGCRMLGILFESPLSSLGVIYGAWPYVTSGYRQTQRLSPFRPFSLYRVDAEKMLPSRLEGW